MATNNILPWASASGANVMDDVDYAAAVAPGGALENGVKTGQAVSAQANKTWRQAVSVAVGVAQYLVDNLLVDVFDSDTAETFSDRLSTSVRLLAQIAPFSATVAAAIGGYPKGALVSNGANGYWVSTVNQNTTVPGASGANWQDLFTGYATQTWTASQIANEATIRANADALLMPKSGGIFTGGVTGTSLALSGNFTTSGNGYFYGNGINLGSVSGTANSPTLWFKSVGDATTTVTLTASGGTSGTSNSGTFHIGASAITLPVCPTFPTASAGDNSTKGANTAYVVGVQTALQGNIATEATTRANNDAALQSQIDSRVPTRPSDDGTNAPVNYLAYYDGDGTPWLSIAKSTGTFNTSLVQTNPGSGFYKVVNLSLNAGGQPIYVSSGGGTTQGITTFSDANTTAVTQVAYQHTNDYLSFNASGSWVLGATQSWTAGQIANEATARANADAGLQSQINVRVITNSTDDGVNAPVTSIRYVDTPGIPWISVAKGTGTFNSNLVQTNPGAGFYEIVNLSTNSTGQPIYLSSNGVTSQGITTFTDANTTQVTQIAYQHINDYISYNIGASWILGATQTWTTGQIAGEATTRANADAGLQSQINVRVSTPASDDGTNAPVGVFWYYKGTGQPWITVNQSGGSVNINLVPTKNSSGTSLCSNLVMDSASAAPIFTRSDGYVAVGATQNWTAGQIAAESTARANADAAESAARSSADTNLQNQLNAISAGTGVSGGHGFTWMIVNGVMMLSFVFDNNATGTAQVINFPKAFGGTPTSVNVISMTKDNDVWCWDFQTGSFTMQTPNGGTNTFSCIAMGAAP